MKDATQVSVEQLETMVSWHMIHNVTAWLSSSVLNSSWDFVCFVDAISNLLAQITGKSQPSVNNIMTGDETSLASSSTTQKWNARFSNRRIYRIIKWPFLDTYTILWRATISFIMSICLCLSVCLSVCTHGTTPLPNHGFLWKLIFEYFQKICQEY